MCLEEKLALNASNKHKTGVQRQKRYIWALNAQNVHHSAFKRQNGVPRQFTCLFGAGMEFLDTSGPVDPTGSSQDLWTSQDPHLPRPLSFHSWSSLLFFIHHLHLSTLPHTPHLPLQFNFSFPPNPTHIAESISPHSPPFYSSSSSLSSFFSCSRASNILSLVW